LLVAGIGQRLRPITNDRPKALVPVGKETIVGRSIRILLAHGVEELVFATGYCEEAVREATKALPARVYYCFNEAFDRTQNSISLMHCEKAVAGRSFYKLDGDLLFHSEVLGRLDKASLPLAVAVDAKAKLGDEEMKVMLRHGTPEISAFGKGLVPKNCYGESIGIERIGESIVSTLFDALRSAQSAGKTNLYYEDVYSELIGAGQICAQAVDVGDLGWAEVDTKQDLAVAEGLVVSGRLGA
jgi:choline kinase